jgi:hypothetical protein
MAMKMMQVKSFAMPSAAVLKQIIASQPKAQKMAPASSNKKLLIYGGVGVVAIAIAIYLVKRKKKS